MKCIRIYLGVFLFLVGGVSGLSQDTPFALRITMGHRATEAIRWKGTIRSDNVRVDSMEGWHFVAGDRVSLNTFELETKPDTPKGLDLQGAASEGARVMVDTNLGSVSFSLSEVELEKATEFLDGLVQVRRLPYGVKLTDDFRDDDYPSIAVADGITAWAVWQSYSGQFDEIRISKYDHGWKTFTRLPSVSGDVWRPQVALDHQKRPWVVWSQQVEGNFDLYARALDPEANAWLAQVRLSTHPYPDFDHHLVRDEQGNLWVVWQGFRGEHSDVFLRRYDGSEWSPLVRVTEDPANDWEPRVAVDREGKAVIVWDTYRNGNYDVYMRTYRDGALGPVMPVAATPKFEAHPSIAIDPEGRVWVAWDESDPNWGKDLGATIDSEWRGKSNLERSRHVPGVRLYKSRGLNLVVFEKDQRRVPIQDVAEVVSTEGETHDSPQLFVDEHTGRVALVFRRRGSASRGRAYWETAVTTYEGSGWSSPVAMPHSWGRISMRPAADFAPDGKLWIVWPTDSREYIQSHRPIVGNIYAASLPSGGTSKQITLQAWKEPEKIEPKVVHPNETADVAEIRAYRTFVHGEEKRIVRGDFHRHTELSWDGGGKVDGSLFDFYRYMIDAADMDFGGVTDHQGGGGYEYWWWLTEKSNDLYHVPGSFTPFYGYERSARFPNGHRNIFHTARGVPVVGFFTKTDFEGQPPGVSTKELMDNDTKLLYESLRQTDGLAISHTSGSNSMGTDWRDNDPEVEPVVEIFQGLRVSYEHVGAPHAARNMKDRPPGGFQEAGFVWNAYRKGYRLGTITSSDHGSTHISYAMVYTEQPTREAIFEAIRKRHTYGATDNIILDYRMGEHFMGEEFSAAEVPPLKIRIVGTAPIAKVEIIKSEKIIYSSTPGKTKVELTFVDQDVSAGTNYYYVRAIQQDRQIAWSSPIWFRYEP